MPWDGDLADGDLALLEMRGDRPVADRSGAVALSGGALVVRGLDAGDYKLRTRRDGMREVDIRVASGATVGRWIVGATRRLESVEARPVVASVKLDTNRLVVELRNGSPRARVHVVAGRFASGQNLFGSMARGMRGGEVGL